MSVVAAPGMRATGGTVPTGMNGGPERDLDVFVSYAREDVEFVRALVAGLERRGHEAWLDADDIPPSAQWRDEVKSAIERANAFLFVVSPDSVSSIQCAAEIAHAGELNKRVIPVVHRRVPASDLSPVVRAHNWIEQKPTESIDHLCDTVSVAISTDLSHVREHTRLLRRAIEWDANRKDPSYLLRGRELVDAERWLRNTGPDLQPAPAPLHAAHIVSSRAATTRGGRVRLFVTSVALVITAALALGAWISREEAVAQRQRAVEQEQIAQDQRAAADGERLIAESRELASMSAMQHETDPELALLLAREGAVRAPTIEAERALRRELQTSPLENTLRGHEGVVWDVAYSPDGLSIVSASRDMTARVWREGREVLALRGHTGTLYAATFSPDGTRIATASVDGTARVWSAADGSEIFSMQHLWEVRDVAFDPRGRFIATIDEQGEVWEWSVAGELLGSWATGPGGHALAIDPVRTRIATAGDDGIGRIWALDESVPAVELGENTGALLDVAFSSDGLHLATAGRDDTVRIWNAESGELEKILRGHDQSVQGVSFSADGTRLISVSVDETARLWEVDSGRQLAVLRGHHDVVQGAAFSPDGWTVATSGEDATVRIWHGDEDGGRTLYGHDSTVSALAATDARVITGAVDGLIGIWDPVGATAIRSLEGHSARVNALVTNANGDRLASGSEDGSARVWDINSGVAVATITPGDGEVRAVALSPDGERVVTFGTNGNVAMWDARSGTQLRRLYTEPTEGGPERGYRAVYAPNGQYVITYVTNQAVIHIWDGVTGEAKATLEQPVAAYFYDSSFSPDGRYLAVAAEDDAVWVWDLESFSLQFELRGHTDAVSVTAWSLNGERIYSAGWDGTVRVWSSSDGSELATLRGHTGMVTALAPMGAWLVSCSLDDTCRIWDTDRGEVMETFPSRDVPVAAANRDGSWVVSTSGSAARLHTCHACGGMADLLALAEQEITREFTPGERTEFLHE